MSSVAEAFRTGGIWMYLILLLQLLCFPSFIALAVLHFKKIRVPWIIWAAPILLILFLGTLGSHIGLSESIEALQHATPETRMKLLARGLALSLNVKVFAGIATLSSAIFAAFMLALSTLGSVKKPRSLTLLPAGLSASLGLMCAITLCGAGMAWKNTALGISAALFTGAAFICCTLANAMKPDDDSAMRHVAAARLGCAGLCFLALWGLGTTYIHLDMIEVFAALEKATPSNRIALLAKGFELVSQTELLSLLLAGSTLLFGLIPALFTIKHATDTRSIIQGVIAIVALLTTLLGSSAMTSYSEASIYNLRIPSARWALQSQVHTPTSEQLPASIDRWDWRPAQDNNSACVLHRTPQDTWALGLAYPEGSLWNTSACESSNDATECASGPGPLDKPLCASSHNAIGLLAPADMLAQDFAAHSWSSSPHTFMLALDAHIEGADADLIHPYFLPLISTPLEGVELTWMPPLPPEKFTSPLVLTRDPDAPDTHVFFERGQQPRRIATLDDLARTMRQMGEDGARLDEMVIFPSPDMTMQDLATLCIISQVEQIRDKDPYGSNKTRPVCTIMLPTKEPAP